MNLFGSSTPSSASASDDIAHCNIGKVFQIYIIQQRIVQKETNDIMQIQSISDAKR